MKNRFLTFLLLSGLFLLSNQESKAQTATYLYFVPLPEIQIHNSFRVLYPSTGTTYHTVISIVPSVSNQVIYYDQWEDGYEANIGAPVQSSTWIFGDGNASNNGPYADIVTAGKPIILQNDLVVPNSPSIIKADGGDKIACAKSLSCVRSSWSTNPGTVMADAVEFLNTQAFGTSFEIPIGQNTASGNMFKLTALHVQASQNATQIIIDKDANGSIDITATINQGESYQVNGGVMQGATVTSNKPVQVDLITGLPGANYESRWYNVYPVGLWDKGYFSPVSTAVSTAESHVFIYNPTSSALPVTVHTNTNLAGTVLSVPAKGTFRYVMPSGSSAHFDNPTTNFFAVGACDADATNTTWDWGYSLVPENYLTTSFYVGWGVGAYNSATQNGNPIWVGSSSTSKSTTVYVDIDGNPATGLLTDINGNKYDYTFAIPAMGSSRLYDNSDNDQTGMHVYTLDGTEIVGAWGEDASKAGAGTPFLDVGTTIAPDPVLRVWKMASLLTDFNGNGLADVNDVIEWKIKVYNQTLQAFPFVILTDILDPHLAYIPGTTKFNGVLIPDDISPFSEFPLDESGFNINPLSTGAKDSLTFNTTFIGPVNIQSVPNTVNAINNFGETFVASVKVPINAAGVTACSIDYTSTDNGATVATYNENATIWIRVTDGDQNLNAAAPDNVQVAVYNAGTFDSETKTLTETGNNTGIFTGSLVSSNSLGAGADNGILYALSGNTIQATYVDMIFGGTCQTSVTIATASNIKQLYLSDSLAAAGMDRVLPWDGTPALSGVIGTAGGSGSVTLYPTQDALLNKAQPTSNYGSATEVAVEGATNPIRSLFQFDLTPYNGYTITSASLLLTRPDAQPTTVAISAHQVNSSWTEGTGTATFAATTNIVPASGTNTNVSWNYRTGTTPWTTAGGDFNAIAVASQVFGSTPVTMTGLGPLVQNWVNTPASNYGMLLKAVTESGTNGATTRYDFYSRNFATVASRPKLTVNYTSAGVSTATFTQTPSMCSSLSVPGGAAISANLYLNIVSGSMPASPSITATVTHGATTIATLSTAGYSGGLLTLSGITSATSIPAGTPVVLTLTNAQAGVTYQIRYDALSYPSKINLPTTSIIDMGTLEVYSAPYPGGSLLTGAINGQTVYVRTTVADPFGAYDIDPPASHPALVITDPSLATSSVVMDQVSTSACGKIYEYAWSTPVAQGAYTLTATSKEGYENTISSTKSAGFILNFTDVGTPCNIAFINQSLSPYIAVTSYAAGSSICLEVNDMDRNTLPSVSETVIATVATSGDSETFTLTETGANTGKFTGCIPSSATLGAGNNNGTLLAPAGTSLTGTFNDLVNAPDICSANAVILQPVANVITLAKTLVAPADGYALLGDSVIWQIVVTNPGTTALNTVNLVDTWSTACLNYVSATPAPSLTTPAGTITWNVTALGGPILSGQNRVILVRFTSKAACGSINNSISATGTAAAGPVTSPVNLIDAKLSILKTRVSPADPIYATISPVTQVVYNIQVTNTGNTVVESIPLLDNYSSANLAFVSSVPAATSSGGGQVEWADLIPGATKLAVGASINVTVTFNVIAGNYPYPVSNNAITGFAAVDVNGKSIPGVSSGVDINIYNLPTAANDEYSTVMDVPVGGNVLANDISPDGFQLTVNTTPVIGPMAGATLVLNADGSFTYTPQAGYTGDDNFTYQVCDANAKCIAATVTIHILPCVNAPNRPNNVIKN